MEIAQNEEQESKNVNLTTDHSVTEILPINATSKHLQVSDAYKYQASRLNNFRQ